MKTELRARPHAVLAGHMVFEIWYGEVLVGEVTGLDNTPGIRVLSRHRVIGRRSDLSGYLSRTGSLTVEGQLPNVLAVEIRP